MSEQVNPAVTHHPVLLKFKDVGCPRKFPSTISQPKRPMKAIKLPGIFLAGPEKSHLTQKSGNIFFKDGNFPKL